MRFSHIATTTAVVAGLLGVGWMTLGHLVLKRWNVAAAPEALLVGRRMGAVYIGMAVLLYLARAAPPSEGRRAIAVGAVVTLLLIACMGLYEWFAGRVAAGILVSVTIELLLAAGFVWTLVRPEKT